MGLAVGGGGEGGGGDGWWLACVVVVPTYFYLVCCLQFAVVCSGQRQSWRRQQASLCLTRTQHVRHSGKDSDHKDPLFFIVWIIVPFSSRMLTRVLYVFFLQFLVLLGKQLLTWPVNGALSPTGTGCPSLDQPARHDPRMKKNGVDSRQQNREVSIVIE